MTRRADDSCAQKAAAMPVGSGDWLGRICECNLINRDRIARYPSSLENAVISPPTVGGKNRTL